MSDRWTAERIPDQTGRTFVVTGAAGGIGWTTTRELVRAGARVVMAVRDPIKAARVADSIPSNPGQIDVRRLDVADMASIRDFAEAWTGPLDVLINNAGVMMTPHTVTDEGFELQTATNYFGPFSLTLALIPHISDRVVSVSSQLHRMGTVHAEDLNWEKRRYNPWFAYCDSKLDLLLFSSELQRRLAAAGGPVRSVVAHPGVAKTNLVSHVGGVSGWLNGLAQPLLNDVENGALPTLYAATEDVPPNAYVGPDGLAGVRGHPVVQKAARRATDGSTAATLWQATADLLDIDQLLLP